MFESLAGPFQTDCNPGSALEDAARGSGWGAACSRQPVQSVSAIISAIPVQVYDEAVLAMTYDEVYQAPCPEIAKLMIATWRGRFATDNFSALAVEIVWPIRPIWDTASQSAMTKDGER